MAFWTRRWRGGGVWRARPRPLPPSAPPTLSPAPSASSSWQDTSVFVCVWCDLLPHSPDALIVFLHLCLAGVSWSSACVRVCVGACACLCRHVCVFFFPPGLISIWSVARPEHDTEGQWVSWNSCGRKPSSYAIRSGYDNTFVYMLRCVCVFCESQLSNLWLWLSFGKVPCTLVHFVFSLFFSCCCVFIIIILIIIQYYNFVGVFVKRALSFQWLSVSRGDCFLGRYSHTSSSCVAGCQESLQWLHSVTGESAQQVTFRLETWREEVWVLGVSHPRVWSIKIQSTQAVKQCGRKQTAAAALYGSVTFNNTKLLFQRFNWDATEMFTHLCFSPLTLQRYNCQQLKHVHVMLSSNLNIEPLYPQTQLQPL